MTDRNSAVNRAVIPVMKRPQTLGSMHQSTQNHHPSDRHEHDRHEHDRTSGSATERTSFTSGLAADFIAEWERLGRSRSIRAKVAAWRLVPDLGEMSWPGGLLDELLDRLGFLNAGDQDEGDRTLFRLVELAATDELAARVVLQRVLPALVSVARRRGPISGGAKCAFEELVATAWIVIRKYPTDRRPRKVAANIVRDAEYLAFVRPQRLRSAGEQVGLPETAPPTAWLSGVAVEIDQDPAIEVRELLELAQRSGLAREDLDFVIAWVEGADTRRLARRFGMCERTVRTRRLQIAYRLRQVALAAEAA